MNAIVTHCSHCSYRLKIPQKYLGKTVRCPKCHEKFQATSDSKTDEPLDSPALPASPALPDSELESKLAARSNIDASFPPPVLPPSNSTLNVLASSNTTDMQHDDVTRLLPPKFLRPELATGQQIKSRRDDSAVWLPTADGGVVKVNPRIVHVEHEGQQMTLVALTDAERTRQRFIVNTVTVAVCLIVLFVAFWLLIWNAN